MIEERNILRGEKFSITFPPDLSMGQFMLDRLSSFGNRVALINGETEEKIRFEEILDSTRRLAVYLSNEGLRRDDRIAVCSENSLNFVIPVCSAMYLGVASCPLNPSYSRREFLHALNISKPTFIFVSASAMKTLREIARELPWSPRLVSMNETATKDAPRMSDLIGATDLPNPENFKARKVDAAEHVMAILCSSGTTGLPKGVMLTDKNFLSITRQLIETAAIGNSSGEIMTLNCLPYFHAYAFVSAINQLALGVTAVMLSRFEPETFLSAIQKYRIKNLMVVPPIMMFLAKSPLVDRYDLSSIEQIWCGAAPLSKNIEEAVHQRLGKPMIKQGYGLTETTLAVLKTTENSSKPGAVGKLTPDTLGKVIPVGEGVSKEPLGPYKEGELCFKGDQIMKGYCGDDISTRTIVDENGWLHTGDIGYYDEDGFFYIVDRLKELIKYKGFQVPPAELEGIMLAHPGVVDAAVIGIPDEKSGELPMGFVVKQPGSKVTAKEIIEFVNGQVSSQKWLRGGVRFVSAIPKTASGKILRRLLRDSFKSKL